MILSEDELNVVEMAKALSSIIRAIPQEHKFMLIEEVECCVGTLAAVTGMLTEFDLVIRKLKFEMGVDLGKAEFVVRLRRLLNMMAE